jgi:hypothetical protein
VHCGRFKITSECMETLLIGSFQGSGVHSRKFESSVMECDETLCASDVSVDADDTDRCNTDTTEDAAGDTEGSTGEDTGACAAQDLVCPDDTYHGRRYISRWDICSYPRSHDIIYYFIASLPDHERHRRNRYEVRASFVISIPPSNSENVAAEMEICPMRIPPGSHRRMVSLS